MQYLILCRSRTYAQRAAALLEGTGISAVVVKAPQGLSSSGCGYAVSLYRRFGEAVAILRANKLLNGKLFKRGDGGEYTEVQSRDIS